MQARLKPSELEMILPGAVLLSADDVSRVCELLGGATISRLLFDCVSTDFGMF